MNLKSKVIGFAAASIFALSMTTGVMAQESDKIDLTAELTYGQCSVELTRADINFGEWKWTGRGYELQFHEHNTAQFNAKVNSGSPKGCNIELGFNGLSVTTGSKSMVIPSSNFRGSLFERDFQTTGTTSHHEQTGEYAGTLKLENVPNTALKGSYVGTVTIGVTNTP